MPPFQCSCSNTPESTYLVVHALEPHLKKGGGGEYIYIYIYIYIPLNLKGGWERVKEKEELLGIEPGYILLLFVFFHAKSTKMVIKALKPASSNNTALGISQ